jgi:hypothetical protein
MKFLNLVCFGLLAISCGGSVEHRPPNDGSGAADPKPAPAAAPECVDEHEQPVECETDADCCKGFACGKDPERSIRVKYCLYAG